MGMGSNNHSWALPVDLDPQFLTFSSTNLAFNTRTFNPQNERFPHSSSTSIDCGFNLHFPFNPPNFYFDASSTFGFEQFSYPSSNLTDISPIVPNNYLSFLAPSTDPAALFNASQPSQFIAALALAPVSAFPSNASSPMIVPCNAPQDIPAPNNTSPQPTTMPVSPANALSDASSPSPAPQHIPASSNASPQLTTMPISPENALFNWLAPSSCQCWEPWKFYSPLRFRHVIVCSSPPGWQLSVWKKSSALQASWANEPYWQKSHKQDHSFRQHWEGEYLKHHTRMDHRIPWPSPQVGLREGLDSMCPGLVWAWTRTVLRILAWCNGTSMVLLWFFFLKH